MAILITVLVTLAVGFPAGWLACRILLGGEAGGEADGIPVARHHELLKAQRSRYRRRVRLMHELVQRHESTRDQIRARLEVLQKTMQENSAAQAELQRQLAERDAQLEAIQASEQASSGNEDATAHELGLVKIERDELLARIHRMECEGRPADAAAAEQVSESNHRAERGELRERLASREHQLREAELRLTERETRIGELEQSVESWKQRLRPLTRQLQLQRDLIRRSRASALQPEEPPAPDDLQRIRGIGPALERRLLANGISNYAQLAGMNANELTELADRLAIAATLPVRDQWVEQARSLLEQLGEKAPLVSA